MAGNVAEWCLNATSDKFVTVGGSWDDLAYLFGYVGELPAFYSSSKLGFRCVLNAHGAQGEQGAMRFDTAGQTPVYHPVSEAEFRNLLTHYRYDKTPLEAKVIEQRETAEWRREKIS